MLSVNGKKMVYAIIRITEELCLSVNIAIEKNKFNELNLIN